MCPDAFEAILIFDNAGLKPCDYERLKTKDLM
jgi:hypothetical protein